MIAGRFWNMCSSTRTNEAITIKRVPNFRARN